MLKILIIFGTRPEAIKMVPVIKEFEKYGNRIVYRVCVTGQHREMLDHVLKLFKINPDYDLNIMQEGQTLSQTAANVFQKLGPVIEIEKPDWILVQGDTTTVMAAGITAFYSGVKVGHIEAGLRTYDKNKPFPEEINRRIAGVVAELHFAPTQTAMNNLIKENIPESTVICTGNTVIDTLLMTADFELKPETNFLKQIDWDKRIILVTAHRRENFGKPLQDICRALLKIASYYNGDVHIIYPVHLNPEVQKTVFHTLKDIKNITLMEPLDYLSFVYLMKKCYLVLTDSGGIQEEAPGFGKPVLVLRDVTERPEAVEAGTARVVGTKMDNIITSVRLLLDDEQVYRQMANTVNPYGDGNAATRICRAILEYDSVKI